MPTPKASESGRLRRGFRTSPAVNVTLFQASDENNDPTIATPTSRMVVKPQSALLQKFEKLRSMAAGLRPSRIPMPISPSKAATFAMVNTFCTWAPVRIPRVLTAVRTISRAIAISCCVFNPTLPAPSR